MSDNGKENDDNGKVKGKKNSVVSLSSFKSKNEDILIDETDEDLQGMEVTPEEAKQLGIDTFNELVEDSVGFVSIMFNQDNKPEVIYAGDLDLLTTMGTFDFVKNELMKNVYQIFDPEDIV